MAGDYRRRPNPLSPVSPSRWSGQAHTRHHRLPDGANHRAVQLGSSMQCVACPWRSWIIRQHWPTSATKALAYGSPGRGIGLMLGEGRWALCTGSIGPRRGTGDCDLRGSPAPAPAPTPGEYVRSGAAKRSPPLNRMIAQRRCPEIGPIGSESAQWMDNRLSLLLAAQPHSGEGLGRATSPPVARMEATHIPTFRGPQVDR